MHTVVILALDGVIPFDLATPEETLGRARLSSGEPAYRLITAAPSPEVRAGTFTLRATHGLEALTEADTIFLPGVRDYTAPIDPVVIDALREAAIAGTRIASICVGTFILAATGLLDGLRASTHWGAADDLARLYPDIDVDPTVLYVEGEQFLTSAGGAAGLDLCLHMIFADHGAEVAAEVSRQCIMPLERAGGQAQFIKHTPAVADSSSLAPLLEWLEHHPGDDLDLATMAERANLSVRTLSRHFLEQTGTTPMAWLQRTRLRQAQTLLETTDQPVERIGTQVGFASVSTFRERFNALVGTSPQAYRRAFRITGQQKRIARTT